MWYRRFPRSAFRPEYRHDRAARCQRGRGGRGGGRGGRDPGPVGPHLRLGGVASRRAVVFVDRPSSPDDARRVQLAQSQVGAAPCRWEAANGVRSPSSLLWKETRGFAADMYDVYFVFLTCWDALIIIITYDDMLPGLIYKAC